MYQELKEVCPVSYLEVTKTIFKVKRKFPHVMTGVILFFSYFNIYSILNSTMPLTAFVLKFRT